jgi:hypothetical protein
LSEPLVAGLIEKALADRKIKIEMAVRVRDITSKSKPSEQDRVVVVEWVR